MASGCSRMEDKKQIISHVRLTKKSGMEGTIKTARAPPDP